MRMKKDSFLYKYLARAVIIAKKTLGVKQRFGEMTYFISIIVIISFVAKTLY